DLGSRNQTLLNSKPVSESFLREGDTIRAGATDFRVVKHLPLTQSQNTIPSNDGNPIECNATNSIVLRPADSRYLQRQTLGQSPGREVRDISGLLRFARSIASVRDSKALEDHVFEAVRELTKAEQATLVFNDDSDGLELSERSWQRTGDTSRQVSRTIIQRV